jgi:biofilm protein TabA
MILDYLKHWRHYAGISSRFQQAFTFLNQFTDDLAVGRHEIDGDDVFALVQKYVTQPGDERRFEAHRKYIDVQYLHRGRELVYWAPLQFLTTTTEPYTAERDAALFQSVPEAMPVQLRAQQFAVMFPDDGHAPCCQWDQPAEVLKVVIKVRV